MNQVDVKTLAGYDLVGLGCPVFYYKEPSNVSDFIEDLPELKEKQWFVFYSHGAVPGITLHSMMEQLEKKGRRVIGNFDVYADASIPFYPRPTYTTGHPDGKDLKDAHNFGRYIAGCSIEVSKGNMGGIKSRCL